MRKINCAQIIIAFFLSQSLSFNPLPVLADNGYIKIAGQPLFSIATPLDSGLIAKRAQTIQDNLDNALVAAHDRTPASVNITYVKGTPVITLGGYQVVTVDAGDAAAAKTTPALLANQWADKIRNALIDQPSINSYVAQLSGDYAASAPPARTANVAPSNINQPDNNSARYSGNQAVNSAPPGNFQPANNPLSGNFQPGNSQPGNNPLSGNYPQGNYQQNNFQPRNSPPDNTPSNSGQQGYDQYNSNSTNSNYNPGYGQTPSPGSYQQPPQSGYRQGRIAYAQVGQIIPVNLETSIATQVARTGDLLQATVTQNVNVGDSVIPSGSIVIGQVTDARSGGRLERSGELQIKFNRLRLPDGSETPISAHIVGGIGKYAQAGGAQSDEVKGETLGNKVGSVAFRGLLGAGGGAALGTAVGAIAGGGHGAGMGAWSGAAIGGGLGAADSLILRKGADVTVPSGTKLQLQLDSPVAISGVAPAGY